MSRLTLLASAGLLLAVGTAALLPAQTPAATRYRQKCAVCHARDGSGNTLKGKKLKIKDLRSPEVVKRSDAEIAKYIAEGHAQGGFASQFTPQQIQALVAYVRSLQHPNP